MSQNSSQSLVWLITGCSSGFGIGIVRKAIKAGHRVIASSRNPSKTPELVREVEQAGGKWIALDVTSSTVKDVVKDALSLFGRIDVLVNNAGFGNWSSVEDHSSEEIKRHFETNVFGPIEVSRALIPSMRENKAGCIVNISSLGGITSSAVGGTYCATKHALEAFSDSMGAELAPFGINVIVVEPGLFRTEILALPIAEPSEPYKTGIVADSLKFYKDLNGKQPGDPLKACERIFELVTDTGLAEGKALKWGQGGFMRVPLGADTLSAYKNRIKMFQENASKWEQVAKETALEGEEAPDWI